MHCCESLINHLVIVFFFNHLHVIPATVQKVLILYIPGLNVLYIKIIYVYIYVY